jgi:6,7-dimethyl-8-ribityllumazine synthase
MSEFKKGLPKLTQKLDGTDLRVLIIHARWNKDIIDKLVEGCELKLKELGVKEENIVYQSVPGSFELPFAAKRLIQKSKQDTSKRAYDAVICIGVLIKGSTMHFEYICESVSQGIMDTGLETEVPVIFGVLTCLTDDQAKIRAGIEVGGDPGHNHGLDWGAAAVEMALLGN